MNFYIADTHFGHSNILRFDHRPFADVYQMEETMVMLWNAAVRKNDTVYILGDFCWGKAEQFVSALEDSKKAQVKKQQTAPIIFVTKDVNRIRQLMAKRFSVK